MRWLSLLFAVVIGGCGSTRPAPVAGPGPAKPGEQTTGPRAVPSGAALPRATEVVVAERFEQYLAGYQDLTGVELRNQLGIGAPSDPALGFDPSSVAYYAEIARQLQLSPEEQRIFAKQGVVSVDHAQRYSMGSAYFAIYARDLPVLITTDSILHAMHRSYDEVLQQLESALLIEKIGDVLTRTHQELARQAPAAAESRLKVSLSDVDLYLTVARNLLLGAGAKDRGNPQSHFPLATDVWSGNLLVPSALGQDKRVLEMLELIRSSKLQDPRQEKTAIYGGERAVDYSQFAPRGHYTKSTLLKRYFRTMMWLGRSDLGWNLGQTSAISMIKTDLPRERRNALLLSYVLERANALTGLQSASAVIDFMVGRSDNVGVSEVVARVEAAGVRSLADLSDDAVVERLAFDLARSGAGRQRIRSQVLGSHVGDTVKTVPPALFQVFGQRFVIDSFVLSQVVFDSIVFRGEKQLRMLPQGLDVMAALGNDEAVRLLEPSIERHKYAANLLAARRVVDDYSPEAWNENLYNAWLNALRTLDDRPAGGPHVPKVMQGEAWRRKQLQTQLGSWAELRHDTVLYAKQSYTAYPVCGYPAAFVEPYPQFFGALAKFGRRAADLLGATSTSHSNWRIEDNLKKLLSAQVAYFELFSGVMGTLETLADKELRARPFTDDEVAFLKRTIDIRGGGSGPPRYDGWYPALIYGANPSDWDPVVADVHTDPKNGRVLEVGVGDVNFMVVAIDNEDDRAVYVGPSYSYYEFTEPASNRLTDEAWQEKINAGKLPPRPQWVAPFQAKPVSRQLGYATTSPAQRKDQDPKAVRDPALSALLSRIAKASGNYGSGAGMVRSISALATSGDPTGPRPPEPTSKAAFDGASAANKVAMLLPRISACGGAGEGVPRASITFGSDGRVLTVKLYPPELERSAARGCIEKELRTVRVPPFNELYRAIPVTLRPRPGR